VKCFYKFSIIYCWGVFYGSGWLINEKVPPDSNITGFFPVAGYECSSISSNIVNISHLAYKPRLACKLYFTLDITLTV